MRALVRNGAFVGLVAALVLMLVAQPAYAQGQVHVVQRGETLSSIAVRYGTTPQAIARANGLANANYIYAGQGLTIPSGGGGGGVSTGGSYTVRAGDSLASIATRFGTTVSALVRANGLSNPNRIYAGQGLTIPGGSSGGGGGGQASGGTSGTYVVRAGDTLASIASRNGTTVQAIVKANGLASANYIYPGQKLRIPNGGGSAPAPAPAGGGGKRIVVDLSAQRMYVYQDGQLLWSWVVSTGVRGGTATGHFRVLNKIPSAWASTWSLKMPHWLGIYWAGSLQNGIHALPILPNGQTLWAGYLGTPVSYGCVILSTQNAATLYNWATVGTPVDIAW